MHAKQQKIKKSKKGQQLHMSTPIRGHSLPLRLTIPPLRTLLGFACSVASLSRCPNHYPPGHHCLRGAALVECPLGQGEPSTRPEGHYGSTCTSLTSFHLDDRRTWPLPAEQNIIMAASILIFKILLKQCALPIQKIKQRAKNCLHFSICACHPCAGAMLIFSVSFQF
jgi:hypothetical protein